MRVIQQSADQNQHCQELILTFHVDDGVVSYLIRATEERLSCVHLHQDASQRPHVDGQVIRHSQQNFRRSVKPALDVLIDLENKMGMES